MPTVPCAVLACTEQLSCTADGWVLNLHRIPRGKQRHAEPGKRPVVLLVHGFSLSSVSFALFNPNESIAYILADAGEALFAEAVC